MRLLPLTALLLVLAACASSRIERYFTEDQAPAVATQDGVRAQLLYFKQSMRHFYATVRLTNSGATPLVFQRSGPGAAQVSLSAEGRTQIADPPTHATWTPWTGTVEQTPEQIARIELAPGASADVSLRWEFPSNTSTYRFDWQMVFHGLQRDGQPTQDLVIPSPGEE